MGKEDTFFDFQIIFKKRNIFLIKNMLYMGKTIAYHFATLN